MVLSKTAQGVMVGWEIKKLGVRPHWVRFGVEKEYGGEEYEVIWLHRT